MTIHIDFSTVAGWLIAAAPVYMPILIAILTALYKQWVSKLPENQRPVVQSIVATGVANAEQVASDALNGPGKKQVAIEVIQKELAQYKINVPQSVISALVEEAVAAMNTQKVAVATPDTVIVPVGKAG